MSNDLRKGAQDTFCGLTLATAPVGIPHRIVCCSLPQKLKVRLAEMGLVAGTTVTVLKVAPLGDPLEIAARGYALCLRAEVAKHFAVAPEKQTVGSKH